MKSKKENKPLYQPEAYPRLYLEMGMMSLDVASRVKELRLGSVIHSWRRISEMICAEYPNQPVSDGWETVDDASGNQLYGIDLCRKAACVLGEDNNDWESEIEKRLG